MFEVSQKRVTPDVLINGGADMAIEVAVWTFADAKRPVDIERQRRVIVWPVLQLR